MALINPGDLHLQTTAEKVAGTTERDLELQSVTEKDPSRTVSFEDVFINENVVVVVSAGAALVRVIDENIFINEAVQPTIPRVQVVDEDIFINENVVPVIASNLVQVVDETIFINENVVPVIASALVQVVDETIFINEATNNTIAKVQVIDENIFINEDTNSAMNKVRVIDETIFINEGIARTGPQDFVVENEPVHIIENIVVISPSVIQPSGVTLDGVNIV